MKSAAADGCSLRTTDAIVRVEAVRLRTALAHYYGGAGAADPIIIDLPRGGYVPELRWRGHATSAQQSAMVALYRRRPRTPSMQACWRNATAIERC